MLFKSTPRNSVSPLKRFEQQNNSEQKLFQSKNRSISNQMVQSSLEFKIKTPKQFESVQYHQQSKQEAQVQKTSPISKIQSNVFNFDNSQNFQKPENNYMTSYQMSFSPLNSRKNLKENSQTQYNSNQKQTETKKQVLQNQNNNINNNNLQESGFSTPKMRQNKESILDQNKQNSSSNQKILSRKLDLNSPQKHTTFQFNSNSVGSKELQEKSANILGQETQKAINRQQNSTSKETDNMKSLIEQKQQAKKKECVQDQNSSSKNQQCLVATCFNCINKNISENKKIEKKIQKISDREFFEQQQKEREQIEREENEKFRNQITEMRKQVEQFNSELQEKRQKEREQQKLLQQRLLFELNQDQLRIQREQEQYIERQKGIKQQKLLQNLSEQIKEKKIQLELQKEQEKQVQNLFCEKFVDQDKNMIKQQERQLFLEQKRQDEEKKRKIQAQINEQKQIDRQRFQTCISEDKNKEISDIIKEKEKREKLIQHWKRSIQEKDLSKQQQSLQEQFYLDSIQKEQQHLQSQAKSEIQYQLEQKKKYYNDLEQQIVKKNIDQKKIKQEEFQFYTNKFINENSQNQPSTLQCHDCKQQRPEKAIEYQFRQI